MLPFEIYNLNISDYENDLLKKTIENHKKRWDVGTPDKWKSYAKVSSNVRFLTEEQYNQNAPMMTFETLMYNHVYGMIDDFTKKYYPEKLGIPYHTEYCWYMYYEQEGHLVAHNHLHTNGIDHEEPPLCCGSYYVEIPEDGERLFNIYDKSPHKDDGVIIKSLRPQPKQLYLFDGGLWHEPIQKNTENSGITIAFNAHLIR